MGPRWGHHGPFLKLESDRKGSHPSHITANDIRYLARRASLEVKIIAILPETPYPAPLRDFYKLPRRCTLGERSLHTDYDWPVVNLIGSQYNETT